MKARRSESGFDMLLTAEKDPLFVCQKNVPKDRKTQGPVIE